MLNFVLVHQGAFYGQGFQPKPIEPPSDVRASSRLGLTAIFF